MLPLRVLVGTLTKPTPPLADEAVLSTDVPLPVAEMAAPEERIFPCSTPSLDWNSALV
jgi:hypothetical protein